jgi:hypothetical protein
MIVSSKWSLPWHKRACRGNICFLGVSKLLLYAADLKLLTHMLLSVGVLCLESSRCWSVGIFPYNSMCVVVWLFDLSSFGRFLPCMCLLLCPRKPPHIHPSSNFTAQGTMMGFCDYTVSWQMQTIDANVFVFYSFCPQ